MLRSAGWHKKIGGRLFEALVISLLVSAFLLSGGGCARFQPYDGHCPSGQYRSPTAEQCVQEPWP
jgi:hypothetical protein